jgi:quinol monooxygenase YgiN
MAGKSLWVQLKAKPGKEKEVADFLTGALPLVEDEPATRTWYALRIGESTFGIFDTFDDDEGRDAHLSGKVAEALMGRADELFSEPPQIDHGDVLAAKH